MDAAPYDNVEFPVRKPGDPGIRTGTWPGPGGHVMAQGKAPPPQTGGKAGSKLAPLVEVEMAEAEDQRLQAKVQMSPSHPSSPALPVASANNASQSSSSPSSSVKLYNTSSSTPNAARSPSPAQSPTKSPASTPIIINAMANQTLKLQQPKVATAPMEDESVDEFSRHNFNPASQALLDKAYTDHRHFYRLTTKILDEGSMLKQDVLDMYRKSGEMLSYEQLLQGMLLDGERLLLGDCWLYFSQVEFLSEDGTKTIKEPLSKGRICLTTQRVLLLSTEISTDASISEFGDPTTPSGGYKIQVKKGNSIYYQNLPLRCFRSAELDVAVGTAALTKISIMNPICWGMCSCFGVGRCVRSWQATPPLTKIYNRRALRLGITLPPWETKTILLLHLDPEMSLTTARDFISHLQIHAPHMQ